MSDDKVKSATVAEAAPAGSTHSMNADAATDLLIGRAIDNGKYIVEKLIGEGGMGKVYRGRNTRTESPVAIKTLIPNLVSDESLVQRFEIEAKAASNLSHPNTISIYDFGREGDVLFMVMELLTGESLDALMTREGALAPDRVVPIIRQVCKSLDEAHGSGLVHRDIKPDNIFLNRVAGQDEDHVKVLDFGVAKLQDKQFGNATLTQAGMIFGTPRYMSPEQARAFPLDGRSDIYALGVVMYEALTGAPPFVADDPVGVLIKHVNEPPTPFATMNPAAPAMPELEAIVMRCLAKDPDQRFDDVRNLLNALSGLVGVSGETRGVSRGAPAQTMALGGGNAPNTPATIASDAFDQLGVSSGKHDGVSRYTLGATTGELDSGDHEMASGRSGILRVGVGIALLVVVAAVALMSLIGGDDSTVVETTVPEDDSPMEVVEDSVVAELVAASVTIASHEFHDGVEGAFEAAVARVITIELGADPPDAGATARVSGSETEPVALPHTFVFTRDPNSPPAQITFEVTADGYVDATLEAALETTAEPLQVRLRRRRSQPSGGRVAIPERDRRSPYD